MQTLLNVINNYIFNFFFQLDCLDQRFPGHAIYLIDSKWKTNKRN